jgi:alkylated DNA repair dioxygenase AlkB
VPDGSLCSFCVNSEAAAIEGGRSVSPADVTDQKFRAAHRSLTAGNRLSRMKRAEAGIVKASTYLLRMSDQADLFETEARQLPPGMRYREDVISEAEERALTRYIEQLPLKPFEFAGGFKGNRRILSFGWRYDYNQQKLVEASPIPAELSELRCAASSFANRHPEELRQALVTEYVPGAGIGWHRDKKMFGNVIGISLLAPCNFKLRLKRDTHWDRMSLHANPRSAYLLSGPSRTVWEHSIPPLDQLRYSITFRTFNN